MSNFWQRLITGIVFLVVIISAMFLDAAAWFAVIAFAAVVGLSEYHMILVAGKLASPSKVLAWCAAGVVLGLSWFAITEPVLWALIPFVWMAVLTVELFRKQDEVFLRMVLALFGQVWIVLPFALLLALSSIDGVYEPWRLLGFFILLWVNDTGAYISGRSFGKHKLAPLLSPGKTWEGFIGGVILSFVAAALLPEFTDVLQARDWFFMAGIVALFSNAGDLAESALKRRCGVKDSGTIMPGHGGILDRFDGVLLSVPLIVAYLLFTNY
jgi:phosphatidate cytidylyltransferase